MALQRTPRCSGVAPLPPSPRRYALRCRLGVSRFPGVLAVVFASAAPGVVAQECFCQYDLDANATTEPLWTCSGGYKQYKCLRKAKQGRRYVARGQTHGGQISEQEASSDYCSSALARDATRACTQVPVGGFGIKYELTTWLAMAGMQVEVTCPDTVNCSNASAYLSSSSTCETSPSVGAPPAEVKWVTAAPWGEIPSPRHVDPVFASHIGNTVRMLEDTIFVVEPSERLVYTFTRAADDPLAIGGVRWNTWPAAEVYIPESSSLFPDQMDISLTGIIVGEFFDGMDGTETTIQVQAWRDVYQKVFVFPRSANGAWPSAGSYMFQQPHYNPAAGFGMVVAMSSNYAAVTSKHSQEIKDDLARVHIFEKGADWATATKVATLGVAYTMPGTGDPGFGKLLAIDDRGVVAVGSPDTKKVYIFVRSSGGTWGTTAVATLTLPNAPVGELMVVAGDYLIVGFPGLNQATVYARSGATYVEDGTLTLSPAATGFGSAVALEDRGAGEAIAVVGAGAVARAALFLRGASGWALYAELGCSGCAGSVGGANPSGFGRAVGVAGNTVVVTAYERTMYLFTRQPTGTLESSEAVPLVGPISGSSQVYTVTFDASQLEVGRPYALCIDEDGDGDIDAIFKHLLLGRGARSKHAEEL